jgi:hypothetical protein
MEKGSSTFAATKVASTRCTMPRVLPSHIVQAINHLFGPRNEIALYRKAVEPDPNPRPDY